MGSKYKVRGGVRTTKACQFPKRQPLQTIVDPDFRYFDPTLPFFATTNATIFIPIVAFSNRRPNHAPVSFNAQVDRGSFLIAKQVYNRRSGGPIAPNQGFFFWFTPSTTGPVTLIGDMYWNGRIDGKIPFQQVTSTCQII